MATSILSRKRDAAYLLFFCIHIPVMIILDLQALYPNSLRDAIPVLHQVKTYYTSTYNDRFFTNPPAWFPVYIWLEGLYHLPLSVWMISALMRDDKLVPLHLLVYSMETAMTTLTCIAEMLSWTNHGADEKGKLLALYVPYLALSVFMGVDMFGRLRSRLTMSSMPAMDAGSKKLQQ